MYSIVFVPVWTVGGRIATERTTTVVDVGPFIRRNNEWKRSVYALVVRRSHQTMKSVMTAFSRGPVVPVAGPVVLLILLAGDAVWVARKRVVSSGCIFWWGGWSRIWKWGKGG